MIREQTLIKPWPTPNWLEANERGVLVNGFICRACGHLITVCPATDLDRWGYECLGPTCPSYDLMRDADYMFDNGEVVRGPGTRGEGDDR